MIDLDETARILTRQNGESIYLRAIRLFEFQSCLFNPKALVSAKDTFSQRSARLLAALRLLEHLEAQILATNELEPISWRGLSENQDYVAIFEKVILQAGGSRAIRSIWRTKTFDDDLTARRSEARAAVNIVDFSYRFAMLRPDASRKAGPTMARSIICDSPSYQYKRGLSTLKTRWREYGPTAALLYLLYVQKFELMPRLVGRVNFSERLLEQAADVGHLKEFFLAYRHLCEILGRRNYKFPPIHSVDGDLPQSLPVLPFPADVDEAIEKNYPSRDRTLRNPLRVG